MPREDVGQAWILSSLRVALADAALAGDWSGPDDELIYTLTLNRDGQSLGSPLKFSATALSRCSSDAGVQGNVLATVRKWVRDVK